MSGQFKYKRSQGRDKFFIQDDENTMQYDPVTMHGSRFWGQMQRQYTVAETLNTDKDHKYLRDYNCHIKANNEIG